MAANGRQPDPAAALYTPQEVSTLFHVDLNTICRWYKDGWIPGDQVITTPGGRRRYRGDWIRAQLAGGAR